MTAAQLKTALAADLTDLLGTYTVGSGTTPAIYMGSPPASFVASGLEVVIDPLVEFDNQLLHSHTSVAREIPVRLIVHGSGDAATAVARITERYETTPPLRVPPSESLGVLGQYTLRIKT